MTHTEISHKATTTIDGQHARCGGLNHRDSGEIVLHDRCHARVAKREDGNLYDVSVSYSGSSMAERYACWNSLHRCNPDMVALVAQERAAKISTGEIVKGATVKVVRGRKVAKGTTGIVIWTGTDSYGKARIGMKDAAGVTHWTAESNVEAVLS